MDVQLFKQEMHKSILGGLYGMNNSRAGTTFPPTLECIAYYLGMGVVLA